MLRLTTKKRYKKSVAWQLDTELDVEESTSACCDVVLITVKKKTISLLAYQEQFYQRYDYSLNGGQHVFTDQSKIVLVNGTSYMTPLDFIQADLKTPIGLDVSGFLHLTKNMDKENHVHLFKDRFYVSGRMSVVVIPTDFIGCDIDTRKCFYMKMFGICDWGRAYFVSKQVLFDIFLLLPTYFAKRSGLDVKPNSTTEKVFDDLVSHSDLLGEMSVQGTKQLHLTARCLFRIICRYHELPDIADQLPKAEETYVVSFTKEKENKYAKSRKSKRV